MSRIRARKLPASERRALIIEGAAGLFAENGFNVSTRAIADKLGITQALLYQYFADKRTLIDAVFEQELIQRWDPKWTALLADQSQPLETRLTRFYQDFLGGMRREAMRLFLHATLAGEDLAARYAMPLDDRVLRPLIGELRAESGIEGFGRIPYRVGERELALVLHGGVVFLGIRKHIYGMPLPDRPDDHVALHVAAFIDGAADRLRAIHALPEGHRFALPFAAKR